MALQRMRHAFRASRTCSEHGPCVTGHSSVGELGAAERSAQNIAQNTEQAIKMHNNAFSTLRALGAGRVARSHPLFVLLSADTTHVHSADTRNRLRRELFMQLAPGAN